MRAAIFDLDGTLTDTIDLVMGAVNAALAPIRGREWAPEEIRTLFGPTEEVLIARATDRDLEQAVERFFRYYEQEHDTRVRLFPGVREMLEELARLGAPVGIVTNKGRRSAEITLRKTGLTGLVRVIGTGDDVDLPKPDPAGIRRVLEALGASPEHALYVGDSPSDMRAARAAGVLAVGAGWFAGDRLNDLADVIAGEPGEIVRMVEDRTFLGSRGGSST